MEEKVIKKKALKSKFGFEAGREYVITLLNGFPNEGEVKIEGVNIYTTVGIMKEIFGIRRTFSDNIKQSVYDIPYKINQGIKNKFNNHVY